MTRGTKHPFPPFRILPSANLVGPIQVEALKTKTSYWIPPSAADNSALSSSILSRRLDYAGISARHFLLFIFFSQAGYRMINPLTGVRAINLSVPLIRDFMILIKKIDIGMLHCSTIRL